MNRRKRRVRRVSGCLVAAACALLLLALLAALILTPQGRALGRRVPYFAYLERAVLGGAKMPEAPFYGIDVSRYQGQIDWTAVSAIPYNIVTGRQGLYEPRGSKPISFVLVKASEGANYADPYLDANRQGVRAAGLRYGAYHVLTLADSELQIANYVGLAQLRRGDFRPIVDLEESILGGNVDKARKVLARILQALEARFACKPIIYCSQAFREAMLGGGFDGYPVYVARYLNADKPQGADIWQFSETGVIEGVPRPVDLDALFQLRFRFDDLLLK